MAPRSPLHFDVALVPGEVTRERASHCAAVVIDTLRFSTVLVRALEVGATSCRAVVSLEEALEFVTRGEADLACGERGGVRPQGFHLGNSPLEYDGPRVEGRRLVFSTTNGTRAAVACRAAAHVLVGCFRNAPAVVRALDWMDLPVLVACAGTEGRMALEDVLAAGALAQRLGGLRPLSLSDGATAALQLWKDLSGRLRDALHGTDHGRTLDALGFGPDVDFAAVSSDTAPVPILDHETGLFLSLPRP